MSFTAKCNNCTATYEAEDDWLGLEAECPECETTIIIEKDKLSIRKTPEPQHSTDDNKTFCSHCNTPLPTPSAILCLECGTNIKTGKKMGAIPTGNTNSANDKQGLAFPSWCGPIVGAIAGALIGLKVCRKTGGELNVSTLITAIILGAIAGSLLFLFELIKKASENKVYPENEATILGKLISIVGLLLSPLPVFGLIPNIISIVINWKTKGWVKIVTIIGLIIAVSITVLSFIGLILNKSKNP